MEHVQQRTSEQQRIRQELHQMRAMLGDEKVKRDEDERSEYQPSGADAPARLAAMFVVRMGSDHVFTSLLLRRSVTQPNTKPSAKAQITSRTARFHGALLFADRRTAAKARALL
jgi:hypothetical protein